MHVRPFTGILTFGTNDAGYAAPNVYRLEVSSTDALKIARFEPSNGSSAKALPEEPGRGRAIGAVLSGYCGMEVTHALSTSTATDR